MTTTLNQITDNETFKQVLDDSMGGLIYDVANLDKYDTTELLKLWEALSPAEREAANGIVTGAINFLQGN